jgi:predicted site-specific integrase-resolvase
MNETTPLDPSYTVDEFCEAERISRVMLYEHWKQGRGPRFYLNGKRRIIPHSARLDWQQRMLAAADGGAHASAA